MSAQQNHASVSLWPIPIWDLPVRLFHWSLVVLLVISWTTAEIGGNAMIYHLWSGYTILTLILFRLLWGFWGSTYARFNDFVRGPRVAIRYARALLQGETPLYPGHNPLGGWMVILLLLILSIQAVTGLFANDDIAVEGPLYPWVSKASSDFLTRIHKLNFNILLILISLHVLAVLFYLAAKGENLIVPMLTGHKWLGPTFQESQVPFARLWLAGALLALAASGVYLLVR
jgi:cytochrome b